MNRDVLDRFSHRCPPTNSNSIDFDRILNIFIRILISRRLVSWHLDPRAEPRSQALPLAERLSVSSRQARRRARARRWPEPGPAIGWDSEAPEEQSKVPELTEHGQSPSDCRPQRVGSLHIGTCARVRMCVCVCVSCACVCVFARIEASARARMLATGACKTALGLTRDPAAAAASAYRLPCSTGNRLTQTTRAVMHTKAV